MLVVNYQDSKTTGLTVVELLIVIVIIGILASLSFSIFQSYQYAGRDAERTSDVEAIARSFEISYLRDIPTSGNPTYPNAAQAVDVGNYKSLFSGQDLEATRAPGISAGTSIVAANNTSQPQNPTKDQYVYMPLRADGSLCGSTYSDCVRFLLYYRLEDETSLRVIESIRQQ